MLKVAMVDHHLNNWHADTFLRLLRGPLAGEEVEVVSAWESDRMGEDWCAKNGVRRADSIPDAIGGVDAVMLLAPDNIDVHLKLAREVLPAGRPTLVDKFLAPNVAEAREIAALAEKHGVPILSASGLRYAVEMDALMDQYRAERPSAGLFTGMGTWKIYGIHTLTMALRVFGPDVKRVLNSGTATASTVTLDYGNDRRAVVDVREAANGYEALGWTFNAKVGDNYVGGRVTDFDGFYLNLMRQCCAFFKSGGKADMDVAEALANVAVLEAGERSLAAGGVWVDL
jgi:predicted dehydrogenase